MGFLFLWQTSALQSDRDLGSPIGFETKVAFARCEKPRRGLMKLAMLLVFVCVTAACAPAQADAEASTKSKIAAL
jgi:hypothetical protein